MFHTMLKPSNSFNLKGKVFISILGWAISFNRLITFFHIAFYTITTKTSEPHCEITS